MTLWSSGSHSHDSAVTEGAPHQTADVFHHLLPELPEVTSSAMRSQAQTGNRSKIHTLKKKKKVKTA